MSVNEQQQKAYEKVVDVVNALMVAVGDLFDNPKEGPLAACVFEARRSLDIAFLFVMKGMNLVNQMSPEEIQKIVDEAVASGKLHLVDGGK